MRLLMITQKIDEADPVLAFTLGWIRALAVRVDHLHVLCLEQHLESLSAPLPSNVTVASMGKERAGRFRRVREFFAFHRAMAQAIRGVDAVFVHMIPRYAWLGAPYVLACRKPQVLWYTHRQRTWELLAAVAVCRYAVTAVPESFPIQTPKLRIIGHGIDADFFAPEAQPETQPCPDEIPLIVYVARLMPIKHQETLLRAAALIPGVRVAIVGAVPSGHDPAYLDQLQTLTRDLGITDRVHFTGGLRPDAVRDMYRRAAVAVNLSPPGLFDKAALESMLTGVPTIVSNPAFDPLLGDLANRLRVESPEDAPKLAESIRALLALPADERRRIGSSLRERTQAAHSLDNQMDRLVALLAGAAGKPAGK